MIVTAARMFQRDGYHATSWRQLVKEAGTPWGSLHHHFPGGKDELGVAALDLGSDGVIALIDHVFTEHDDAGRAVALWFELSGEQLVDTDFESGCPVATVALETVASPGPVKDAARSAFSAWRNALRRIFGAPAPLAPVPLMRRPRSSRSSRARCCWPACTPGLIRCAWRRDRLRRSSARPFGAAQKGHLPID